MNETEQNQQIAETICRDLKWNDQQFQIGDCVALLDGQIVGVAKNLSDALQELRDIEPLASRGMIVEVRPPIPDVIR